MKKIMFIMLCSVSAGLLSMKQPFKAGCIACAHQNDLLSGGYLGYENNDAINYIVEKDGEKRNFKFSYWSAYSQLSDGVAPDCEIEWQEDVVDLKMDKDVFFPERIAVMKQKERLYSQENSQAELKQKVLQKVIDWEIFSRPNAKPQD